jgi:hypothetical protein
MQPATAQGPFTYQRHRPEETVLYKIVQENLENFLLLVQEETGHPLPDFVQKEFREYLRCGILAHGFLRVQCGSCHNEHLVAFSCKLRGFCPSCGGRRMAETAAHLVDQVLPVKPIRQWVMSFPIQLRLLLAIRPKLMGEVLNITHSAISTFLCKKAGFKKSQAKTGAVTLIQRFGGSVNLNIHFHQLYIDGVYELDANQQPSTFHMTPAPIPTELAEVLEKIITKITRLLEQKGIIVKEEPSFQLEISDDDSFAKLQAGAVNYRFAMGPNKGKKALTLRTVTEQDHNATRGLVAKNSGFSLHAGVHIAGSEREKLEKLCRYIARPAIALERLSLNANGQVVYSLKKPYDDGTTHIVMTPLELMEKIAAIIPRPRVHLTRFHGVLAPHYKHRKIIVPAKPLPQPELELAPNQEEKATKSRISWARLLKRVFNIDVATCHICGGKAKIVAAIEDPKVIMKILNHLGLDAIPPNIWPARGPPVSGFDEFSQHPQIDFT